MSAYVGSSKNLKDLQKVEDQPSPLHSAKSGGLVWGRWARAAERRGEDSPLPPPPSPHRAKSRPKLEGERDLDRNRKVSEIKEEGKLHLEGKRNLDQNRKVGEF